jgi:hypothetical protein
VTRPTAPQRRPAGRPTAGRPPKTQSRWRRFVARYGWRAYALPVLVLVSVVALSTTSFHKQRNTALDTGAALSTGVAVPASSPPASRTGTPSTTVRSSASKPSATPATRALSPLALPLGGTYSKSGNGTFTTVPGTSGVIGKGRLYRFSIEIENGVSGVDTKAFAATVMKALGDSRSWTHTGQVSLQRVDTGAVDFHLSLVSSMTVRSLCGYTLPVETSCYDGGQSRVVLNVSRWVRGAQVYPDELATYRLYAVNHEVGHALGHNHSHSCLSSGLAPVMMQQTIGTKTATGKVCGANPWPYPTGDSDAPGAEQPGDGPDSDFFRRNS